MAIFKQHGNFEKTEKFLNRVHGATYLNMLNEYGQEGVRALASATPVDSGETASCWTYEIEKTATTTTLVWKNTNINDGANIAILIQYGHGTGTGGYVSGQDYINPAIKPVFDKIAQELWRGVTSA